MEAVKQSKKALNKAVLAIESGKVMVCPTDTVYGILADATNCLAVEKVFGLKQRPKSKAMPVFVKDLRMAKKVAVISKRKADFLKKIWPGKVTVVLKAKKESGISPMLFGDKGTIGLRIPKHDFIKEILSKTKRPLVGTSANISGHPATTKIREVKKSFANKKDQLDLLISAGNLPAARPSVVVNLARKKIKIVRRGDYLKTVKYKFLET